MRIRIAYGGGAAVVGLGVLRLRILRGDGACVRVRVCVEATAYRVNQAGNALIYGQSYEYRGDTAQKVERHYRHPQIEIIKVLLRARREQRAHHAEQRLPAPVEKHLNVERHEHQPIKQYRHGHFRARARRHCDNRALKCAVLFVDNARRNGEHTRRDQVGQVADEHGGSALKQQL